MPQAAPVTPEEFAKQLGGTVRAVPPPQPPRGPATTALGAAEALPDPDAFAASLGGRVAPAASGLTTVDATAPSTISANPLSRQIGNAVRRAVPAAAATIGAARGAVMGAPAGPAGSFFGAAAGAGTGGGIGAGLNMLIDFAMGKPTPTAREALSTVASTATEEMLLEAGGRVPGAVVSRLRGSAARQIAASGDVSATATRERIAANAELDLGLSTPELTQGGLGRRVQYTGSRGVGGSRIQLRRQAETAKRTQTILSTMLDDIAPATTRAATGRTVAASINTARQGGFAEVQKRYGALVKAGPAVDIRPLKDTASRMFHDEVMPALETIPEMGPKTAAFQQLKQLYKDGKLVEFGTEMKKILADDALMKSTDPIIKTIRRVVTARDLLEFPVATQLRTGLRQAGKAPGELLGDKSSGAATHLATNLRGLMAEAYPEWDRAAAAYGGDARLFQQRFMRDLVTKDPEGVLSALKSEGAPSATRLQQLRRVLVDIPKESPRTADAAAGQAAWDALRRTWTERHLTTGDLTKLADRLAKLDPETIPVMFDGAAGSSALLTLKKLATALKTQEAPQRSRIYETVEAGSIMGSLAYGNVPAALTALVGYEGIPAFLSWAIYNPQARNFLLDATKRDAPRVSIGPAIARAVQIWRASQEAAEPSTPPPPGTEP